MRLLSLDDLHARGIRYTRRHIARLVNAGRFPRPIKFGEAVTSPNAWIEDEIDAHLEMLARKREQPAKRVKSGQRMAKAGSRQRS